MDVGALRKVLKRYGHWRRLQDHVTMLSEAEGAPIGRALTPEEQKRLLDTAASNPEWEHVYCAADLAANTSMRGLEVKHVRKDGDPGEGEPEHVFQAVTGQLSKKTLEHYSHQQLKSKGDQLSIAVSQKQPLRDGF